MCECTFLYKATILDLVTVEDWGKEKFANEVDVKWKMGPTPQPTSVLNQGCQ